MNVKKGNFHTSARLDNSSEVQTTRRVLVWPDHSRGLPNNQTETLSETCVFVLLVFVKKLFLGWKVLEILYLDEEIRSPSHSGPEFSRMTVKEVLTPLENRRFNWGKWIKYVKSKQMLSITPPCEWKTPWAAFMCGAGLQKHNLLSIKTLHILWNMCDPSFRPSCFSNLSWASLKLCFDMFWLAAPFGLRWGRCVHELGSGEAAAAVWSGLWGRSPARSFQQAERLRNASASRVVLDLWFMTRICSGHIIWKLRLQMNRLPLHFIISWRLVAGLKEGKSLKHVGLHLKDSSSSDAEGFLTPSVWKDNQQMTKIKSRKTFAEIQFTFI